MERRTAFMSIVLAALALFTNVGVAAPLMRGAPAVVFPKIHLLNQNEIPAGKLAQIKACRPEVRQFGQILSLHHFQADRELTLQARRFATPLGNPRLELWEARNIRGQQIRMRQLQLMRGCQFDRQFLLAMRDAHGFAIRMVSFAIADPNSLPIRGYLSRTLHALQAHYNMAVRLLTLHEPAEEPSLSMR